MREEWVHGSQVFQFVKEIQSFTNKQYKNRYISDRFTVKKKETKIQVDFFSRLK